MATDYPAPDKPVGDAASAVKEAIWQATSRAWNENRPTYPGSRAEPYLKAVRALTDLETPAKTLLANLQNHHGDQEIVLDNEARQLASRVLSGVLRAAAELINVDVGIAEIFYPGLSDDVGDAMFGDIGLSYLISDLLKNADAIEARACAAGHPQSSQLGELDSFEDEEASNAWPMMLPEQRWEREEVASNRDFEADLFQKMREHSKLDVTRLEERFHIKGAMSSDMVAELESLLSVLGQVRSQLVTIIRDNWRLRDVVDPPQPETVRVTVGDVYANVTNSVIAARRARIEGTVNNVSSAVPPDVADALRVIGEHVAKANDDEAASDFESLTRELAKPEPDKSRLSARWDALVSVLPGIMSLTDAVAKIKGLF